jgi:hypothetical protein
LCFAQQRSGNGKKRDDRHAHHSNCGIRADAVMDTGEAWASKLRAQRHIGDFRHWKDHDSYQTSFQRVLRDLKRAAEPEK